MISVLDLEMHSKKDGLMMNRYVIKNMYSKMLVMIESQWWVYEYLSYVRFNSSACLKNVHNKKLEKNYFEFFWRGMRKRIVF